MVSLAPNSRGTGFLSGHADGNIIRYNSFPKLRSSVKKYIIFRFYVNDEGSEGSEGQGRVVVHPVPPYALAWPQGQILAAGCDKRVLIYNAQGKLVKHYDYSRDDTEKEFTVACCSPSGQVFSSHTILKFSLIQL